MDWMQQLLMLGDVAIAGLLGGAIGSEREWAGKPAGLRTHMIVAAAAALLMSLGKVVILTFETGHSQAIVRTDPIRIIQAIVLGISFLGAGTIVTNVRSERVEGLTTAASILLTTAVGITVAIGQWILASGVTLGVLLVLLGVRGAERLVRGKHRTRRRDTGGAQRGE